ncbi:MAG: hypothetical protein FJ030_10430 [Chloroflexi bacterium]|nr:hypothetical protein [Chloroflexota bacterium]
MTQSRKTESPAGDVYDVFAKIKPEDPLRYVGNVVAPDVELARVYAFTVYQEWTWSEMIAVPRRAVIHIVEAP